MLSKILFFIFNIHVFIKFYITNYRFKKTALRKYKFSIFRSYTDKKPFYTAIVEAPTQQDAYTLLTADHTDAYLEGGYVKIKEVI